MNNVKKIMVLLIEVKTSILVDDFPGDETGHFVDEKSHDMGELLGLTELNRPGFTGDPIT
jgi:hypothetical protein